MSEPRVIKKYPNRRLYDTAVSSYITLEDVRRLVMEQTPFCIKDAKTKEDITRSILLQIIMEQEADGEPIFSEQILQQIIRFYGDSLQDMIASYLEKSVQLFADQQKSLREQMHNVMSGDPLTFMRDVTEQNLALWKDMQTSFLGTGVGRSPRRAKATRAGKERASSRKP